MIGIIYPNENRYELHTGGEEPSESGTGMPLKRLLQMGVTSLVYINSECEKDNRMVHYLDGYFFQYAELGDDTHRRTGVMLPVQWNQYNEDYYITQYNLYAYETSN